MQHWAQRRNSPPHPAPTLPQKTKVGMKGRHPPTRKSLPHRFHFCIALQCLSWTRHVKYFSFPGRLSPNPIPDHNFWNACHSEFIASFHPSPSFFGHSSRYFLHRYHPSSSNVFRPSSAGIIVACGTLCANSLESRRRRHDGSGNQQHR